MSLTPEAGFWFDSTGQVAAATAMKAGFVPMTHPNFGHSMGTLWVQLVLDNPGPPTDRLLRVSPALLEQIELWQPGDPVKPHRSGGLALPMAEREMPDRNMLFPLSLTHGTQVLYLRLASPSVLQPVIELWQPSAWARETRLYDLKTALMNGALMMVVLLTLAYILTTREVFWAWYALGILAYATYEVSYDGFAAVWIWPARPGLSLTILPAALALALSALTLFFMRFMPMTGLGRARWLLWSVPLSALLGLLLVYGVDYLSGPVRL